MNALDKKITVLKVIHIYYEIYGILPSYQTICSLSEIRSKNTIHHIISSLIEDGFFDINVDNKLYPLNKFHSYKEAT